MRRRELYVIGWREWVGLPELELPAVKAKIDTGARTSALHAVNLERFRRRGKPWVRFEVHPHQRDVKNSVVAEAVIIDERSIRNSGGASEHRPVILTTVNLGPLSLPIELTLTNRALMGFRMLLGREAVRNRFYIDPGASFCLREPTTLRQSLRPQSAQRRLSTRRRKAPDERSD